MLTEEVKMVCGSLKLALLGSLSYSYWTIVLYLNRGVSIKLERYPKKDRRRERLKEKERERVLLIRSLTKVEKMVYVNVSFHGSLKLTLGLPLLQSVSYFSKQRRMERRMAGNNRERERKRDLFDSIWSNMKPLPLCSRFWNIFCKAEKHKWLNLCDDTS